MAMAMVARCKRKRQRGSDFKHFWVPFLDFFCFFFSSFLGLLRCIWLIGRYLSTESQIFKDNSNMFKDVWTYLKYLKTIVNIGGGSEGC